ncbi:PD-(D/E)XK nuclease family protein [Actinomarinicola tropica]|uniref:PD-(D/E)XK endonuclease-like domain-containing protein n=1 Tax=Actinomarinicola tropica TaxID=2789776 RepID=A0A5Q2RNJ8_9ACTN|nr:PD-(D/E)XK nuclease family protein [Actinomarinicola tropica]QGG96161.1 hypothetical protein GH723_14210 [Actinomarinicola tropica]
MGQDRLQVVPHGRPATAALGRAIAAAKGDDPLAPVTVAVAHPRAGLSLRRTLAARRGGVVNVQFLVLPRIVELLGAPSLAAQGRRPRTATVARAAARAVLRDAPGRVLAPAADHHATEAAVVRLVEDLASVGADGRRRLADLGGRAADLAALAERVLAAAPDRYDRHDLTRAAVESVRRGRAGQLGHLVVHLPSRLHPAEVELVGALADQDAVTVLLGVTGHPTADATVAALRERLEPILGAASEPDRPSPPTAQRIITTTDADDEVRAALRAVVEHWEQGTPLERTAIAYPSSEPYARLLQEQAAAAQLPISATATATLASSVVGRTLLGALALAPHERLERDRLIAWLAAAPIRDADGQRVPTTRWDVLTRRAGIVAGGLAEWHRHLDAHVERLRDDAARRARATPDAASASRAERDEREVERLRTFLTWLAELHRRVDDAGSWEQMATAARALVHATLGPEGRWAGWPEHQTEAGVAVLDALERLGALDEVEPSPRATSFRRALAAELDVVHGRTGATGRGLLVVPLHHAVGLDLDLLVVVGLAEGTLPGRTSDDALVPDADRERAGLDLPRRADVVVEQHHRLLAAMAGAERRILLMPRGDLRQGRERIPSRWLLDSAAALVGAPVTTRSFATLDHPAIEEVRSFTSGTAAAAHHLSLTDRDLSDLAGWVADGRAAHEHPITTEVPALGHAMAVLRARRLGGFGRFTGHVTGVEIPTFRDGGALSPTALERWAACPRRYFFAQVLRLREEERPEVIDRITPRDRGSLVHETLDRFLDEVISTGPKAPDERWSPTERSRAHALLDEVGAGFEDQGLTGRPVFWALDRVALHRDLDRFLDLDDQLRAQNRSTPVSTELPFGPDEPVRAVLDLPGDRRIEFRGFADRVDRTEDGGLLVLDYKTGGAREAKAIAEGEDKLLRGEKLQLPVYALAARTAHPDATGPVHTAYWHISDKGGWERYGYTSEPEHEARFEEVLTTIADGIEAGHFPGRPGPPSTRLGKPPFERCLHCAFDVVCGRDRGVEWQNVRLAPELHDLLVLAGEIDEDPDENPADDAEAAS